MHLQENTLFDILVGIGVKVTQKRRPVPIYASTKIEVANVQRFRRRYNYKKRDRRTDAQTDFGIKLIYPSFQRKKRV